VTFVIYTMFGSRRSDGGILWLYNLKRHTFDCGIQLTLPKRGFFILRR